ncbi:MAG TPA: serine/threonine-protein kinase [Acidimicrobiales bacterium]
MASVGDYELERQIGAGAAGTVWRAHRSGPVNRVVALKRLRAGSGAVDLARIRREATLLTELDHPHIVRVLEVVHDGDGVALAMQFAPGGSLQDLLAERGRLAPGEVVAVAAPVADALASAHRRGVLHGDVKPANVMFTSDGEPLLTDFGVARTLGQVTSDQASGTAEYVAPELLEGAQPDPRADVYSLGIVCYQALAGAPPYTGPAPLAVIRAADQGIHQPLSTIAGIPPSLAEVVERAMHRDPGQRFPTADTFARALRSALPPDAIVLPGPASGPAPSEADPGTGATRTFGPRPPRPEPPAPHRRRLPWAVAIVGLVAAGLLFLVRGPLGSGDDDCKAQQPLAVTPGGALVEGDVDGNGCVVQGIYQLQQVTGAGNLMVLTIDQGGARKRIQLGEPGDQLILGDWDCDGDATPGLYKAAAGEVQYYDAWPGVAAQTLQPDRTETVDAGGRAELVEGRGSRCDRVSVAPASESSGSVPGGQTVTTSG